MTRHRTFRTRFLGSLIAAFFLFFWAASVDSAPGANETITIYPPAPSFTEPFTITVSGQWATSCTPIYESVAVDSISVRLIARTPGPQVECQAEPTDWEFSVQISPQKPNFYEVRVTIFSGITGDILAIAGNELEVIGGLQVIPPQPQATEEVTLRLAGFSWDACTPLYVSHSVITRTVTVEAQMPADRVCGQVPTPWQMDAALGQHPAGTYQVELIVTDHRHSPPERTRLMEDSFVIVERRWVNYLPLLSSFGSNISASAYPSTLRQGMTP